MPSIYPGRMNPRTVVGALAVGALLVAFLTWRGHLDAVGATLTALFGGVAVFLRPDRSSGNSETRLPRDTQSGRRVSWSEGGHPTDVQPTVEATTEQRAASIKTDLLIEWAKAGEKIDAATELKAQLTVEEIFERGARWLRPGDLSVAPPPSDDGGETEH